MTNADMIDVLMGEHSDKLTPWEGDFLEDLTMKDDSFDLEKGLTDDQQKKLDQIYDERVG